jgi:hypothetical protein
VSTLWKRGPAKQPVCPKNVSDSRRTMNEAAKRVEHAVIVVAGHRLPRDHYGQQTPNMPIPCRTTAEEVLLMIGA